MVDLIFPGFGFDSDRAFLECDRIYLMGSFDNIFKSAAGIQAAVTGLYGKESIRAAIKPYVYEVIATRRNVHDSR